MSESATSTDTCPGCGGPINGITTTGPGEHHVSPCGCEVGSLGPYSTTVTEEVRP